jgi:DNA-binding NarL/FixJ family response regulator
MSCSPALAYDGVAHHERRRPRLRLVHGHDHVVRLETRQRLIRVAIASGPALMRAGFRALLEAEHDVAVAGEAASGEDAVELAHREQPDVILVDAALPGIGALEATRLIAAHEAKVLAIGRDDDAVETLRAGASGFLTDDTEPAELVRALRVVARGDALLSPSVTRRVLRVLT